MVPLSDARENLKSIYTAAISAVDPAAAMESHLKREGDVLGLYSDGRLFKTYDLKNFERFIVVGAGKAAAPMAKAVERILGDLITVGCVCVKYGYTEALSKIQVVEAAHPVPDAEGVRGTRRILELLEGAGSRDLVISLISGGGSALLVLPPDSISLDDKRATTELLLKSGAGIHEINTVRKASDRRVASPLVKSPAPQQDAAVSANSAAMKDVFKDGLHVGCVACCSDAGHSGVYCPEGCLFQIDLVHDWFIKQVSGPGLFAGCASFTWNNESNGISRSHCSIITIIM